MNPTPLYIDAHLHLQDQRLKQDVAGVIQRAQAAGVNTFLCNGTNPADWPHVLDLAQRHTGVIPFLGLHPWNVDQVPDDWLDRLKRMIGDGDGGIGEIGLDFAKSSDPTKQQEAFEAQLDLAARLNRPVSIHCVKAWNGLLESLRKFKLSQGFMMHAFNGSPQIAQDLIHLGGYVSFNALSFTKNRRAKTRELLTRLPQDRILFETESPFGLNTAVGFLELAAEPINEPANLPLIVQQAAELMGHDVNDYARMIYENGTRFIRPLKEMKNE